MNRILVLLAAAVSCTVLAAPGTFDRAGMAARYQDMLRCMDRAIGKDWQSRYDIDLLTNRWGAAEPSAQDIGASPEAVRLSDYRCRREVSLEGQPRPD